MIPTKFDNVFVDGEDIYRFINGEYHQLSKWKDNVGYYQVVFRINGKRTYVRVHRLIAETMIPNPNNYKQINHKDGNKLNNAIDNLEWTTNQENTQHAYDNRLYRSTYKCAIKVVNKLTRESGIYRSIRNCASSLNLNRKTITAILKNEKSNNYPFEFEYV